MNSKDKINIENKMSINLENLSNNLVTKSVPSS
jgi:hypothetical protein